MAERDGALEPLAGKSPVLFLVAGTLLVVFAANTGVRVFAGSGVPAVHSILGPAGFFVGIVGALGLYPGLADRTPWGARTAAVVAAVPLVGWFVIAVFGIGNSAGVLPAMSVVLPGAVVVPVFLTTLLTYILFGAASLRTDVHSRSVGVLLLAPAVPFLTLILAVGVMPPVEWGEFVIDAGHALAHLAVGAALGAEGGPTDHAEPTADATP